MARVTTLARTVVDLAMVLPFTWGVIATDQALARGMRREQLMEVVDAAAGRAGAAKVRAVAAFADGRSQSPAESASRVSIARAGLPMPELQYGVVGADGWVATTDFGWKRWGSGR